MLWTLNVNFLMDHITISLVSRYILLACEMEVFYEITSSDNVFISIIDASDMT